MIPSRLLGRQVEETDLNLRAAGFQSTCSRFKAILFGSELCTHIVEESDYCFIATSVSLNKLLILSLLDLV